MSTLPRARWFRLPAFVLGLVLVHSEPSSGQDCGPFTDVAQSDQYCASILQIYYLGLTAGTSPTTFGPTLPVTRQALALLLARAGQGASSGSISRRTILGEHWTTQGPDSLYAMVVDDQPLHVKCDGTDVWVTHGFGNTVLRVRGSDGKLLDTWTGATGGRQVLAAMGSIFAVGLTNPGNLYQIDPRQPGGPVVTVTSALGDAPVGIAFDGAKIWTGNASGSVSIVTPGTWSVSTVSTGFTQPLGLVYDGTNMWAADNDAGTLLKLNGAGAIVQTVTVGGGPAFPTYDGTNIWVPNIDDDSVTVVRRASGAVLATLTGNGLSDPVVAAFDGQRILVTNSGGSSVSLWRAADFAPLGSFSVGTATTPIGVCSDGINFWIALSAVDSLARF